MTTDTATVTVGELAPGGRAFARTEDGRVLFIEGALPGEQVEVAITRSRAGVHEARVTRMLSASEDRVDPPCPWVETCGGCDWMMASEALQLRAKGEIIAQAAHRQAHLSIEAPAPRPAPDSLGYRSRIRLHIDPAGRVGYFARGTHDVVEVERCAVACDVCNDALAALRTLSNRLGRDLGALFSGVELLEGDEDCPWAMHLFPRNRRAVIPSPLRSQLKSLAGDRGALWVAGQTKVGHARLRYPLPGGLYQLQGPTTFTQVNRRANQALVEQTVRVVTELLPTGGRFVDLYCGSGNFTLPLLAAGLQGVGVELSADAIRCAQEAARRQRLPHNSFLQQKVGTDPITGMSDPSTDLVILDPPRFGAKDALGTIVGLKPRSVVYVGCDPVTQCRDLAILRDSGYQPLPPGPSSWLAFDLFPQTHHVETLIALQRPE